MASSYKTQAMETRNPSESLLGCPKEITSLIVSNLSNPEWAALSLTSKGWKQFIDKFVCEFVEKNPLFYCKQFKIDMLNFGDYNFASDLNHFYVFKQIGHHPLEKTTIDYFNTLTLTQHNTTVEGDYTNFAGLYCKTQCPQGLLIYSYPNLKLLTINESKIELSDSPIQVNSNGIIYSMACNNHNLLANFRVFDSGNNDLCQLHCWDLTRPTDGAQIVTTSAGKNILCFGEKFLVQNNFRYLIDPQTEGLIKKHIINTPPQCRILCADYKTDTLISEENDGLWYVREVSEHPTGKKIDTLPETYYVVAMHLKGQSLFTVGALKNQTNTQKEPHGIFTIYDLKTNKIIIQQLFDNSPLDMHQQGKYLFVPTNRYKLTNHTNGSNHYTAVDHKLMVINIQYWLKNS